MESVGIGVHADLGVGSTRLGASETLSSTRMHGSTGQTLIQNVSERHGIEESRVAFGPTVIEQSESVERRGLANRKARLTSSNFSCVESRGIT
jgi:hypothetical protein